MAAHRGRHIAPVSPVRDVVRGVVNSRITWLGGADQSRPPGKDISIEPLEHPCRGVAPDAGIDADRRRLVRLDQGLADKHGVGVAVGDGVAEEDDSLGFAAGAGGG